MPLREPSCDTAVVFASFVDQTDFAENFSEKAPLGLLRAPLLLLSHTLTGSNEPPEIGVSCVEGSLVNEQVLYSRPRMALGLTIAGAVSLGVGVVALALGVRIAGTLIPIGALAFLLGMIWRCMPTIRVHNSHLLVRSAPVRSARRVPIKDIVAMRLPHPKLLELWLRRRGDRPDRLKVELAGLEPRELEYFLGWLRRRVPGPAERSSEPFARAG